MHKCSTACALGQASVTGRVPPTNKAKIPDLGSYSVDFALVSVWKCVRVCTDDYAAMTAPPSRST